MLLNHKSSMENPAATTLRFRCLPTIRTASTSLLAVVVSKIAVLQYVNMIEIMDNYRGNLRMSMRRASTTTEAKHCSGQFRPNLQTELESLKETLGEVNTFCFSIL